MSHGCTTVGNTVGYTRACACTHIHTHEIKREYVREAGRGQIINGIATRVWIPLRVTGIHRISLARE